MPELRDVMSPEVVAISAEASVVDAAQAMMGAKAGSVVVMQGTWLLGILTERDVLRAAASAEDLTDSPVSRWMTRDPMTATLDMSTDEAADLMLLNGFRHLPVVEGREVRGVVSIRDLMAARIRRPAKS